MNIARNTVHLRKTCSPSGALYPHSANLQSREGQVQDQSPLRKKKNGVFEISFENNFGMLSIGPKFKWFINQERILRFSEPSVVLVNHRAWTLMEKIKGLWERPGVKFSPETCEQVWGMMALQCQHNYDASLTQHFNASTPEHATWTSPTYYSLPFPTHKAKTQIYKLVLIWYLKQGNSKERQDLQKHRNTNLHIWISETTHSYCFPTCRWNSSWWLFF